LKFQQRKQAIVNDILIDDPEEDNIFERPQPKDFHKYVEYYFDLRVDKEIQEPVDLGTVPSLPKNLQEVCED